MARFNLKKGDRFKLDKREGLNNLQVHLTWDDTPDDPMDLDSFLVMTALLHVMRTSFSIIPRIVRSLMIESSLVPKRTGSKKFALCQQMDLYSVQLTSLMAVTMKASSLMSVLTN